MTDQELRELLSKSWKDGYKHGAWADGRTKLLKDAEYIIGAFERGCDADDYWRDIADWREAVKQVEAK